MWRRVNTNRGVWPCARVGREGYGWAGRSTMTQGCLFCPGSGQRTSPAKRFLRWDYQVKSCFPNRSEIDITIFRYFCWSIYITLDLFIFHWNPLSFPAWLPVGVWSCPCLLTAWLKHSVTPSANKALVSQYREPCCSATVLPSSQVTWFAPSDVHVDG